MSYFTDLFTVETYEAFLASDRTVSGFRAAQRKMAARIRPGDKLLAYVVGLSRWAGVLRVRSAPFEEHTPLFLREDDPFVIRFRVEPEVLLPLEQALPIREPEVFGQLSFTRGRETAYWLGPLRRSLAHIDDRDGSLLENLLRRQAEQARRYPIDPEQLEALRRRRIRRADGPVSVSVPAEEPKPEQAVPLKATRDSIRIQADLAYIGEQMQFRIWLPRNDRGAVLHYWRPGDAVLLDTLPLNYDETTIQTIENIDVLWLKGRAIQRAFEVEHSTAIYSGLLRMADLLALQPNMDIKLHIVAPAERRDEVLAQIRRPVFSLLEGQPLSRRCTFLAYEDVREIKDQRYLTHLSDSILEEYEDYAAE